MSPNSLRGRLHRLFVHPLKELLGYYDRHEDRVREDALPSFREQLKERCEEDAKGEAK
jgi:hypothetical protein